MLHFLFSIRNIFLFVLFLFYTLFFAMLRLYIVFRLDKNGDVARLQTQILFK